MCKVSRYKMWCRLRDEYSQRGSNPNSRKYEKYAFNAAMNKPDEKDWVEYTFLLLSKDPEDQNDV